MSIAASVLPEFDQEMANTRTMLERVPEARAEWTPTRQILDPGRAGVAHRQPSQAGPHCDGSRRAGRSATGTATRRDSIPRRLFFARSTTTSRRARIAIESAYGLGHDGALDPSQIRQDVWTLPRAAVLRSFILSHMIHHRGQLSVYLRLNDVPVPPVYGPSADSKASFRRLE